MIDLLRQLPHRGELHPPLATEPFLHEILPGLQSNLFTGFTFVQRGERPSGALAFHKGRLIYGRLSAEEAELDLLDELKQIPAETTFVSVRMMRHVMRAGFALIEGRQIGLWPLSSPAAVAQARQKFTATSLGVLAWIGAEPRLCIYEHGLLMRESPQPDPACPGPLVQYEALDELPEGLDLLAALDGGATVAPAPSWPDLGAAITPEPVLGEVSEVEAAPSAVEIPTPTADLSAAWTLLEDMFTKKVGRAATPALAALRVSVEGLPAEAQLEQMKVALESNFGAKAVSYFEQRL